MFDVGKVGRGSECGETGSSPSELIEYVAADKLGYVAIKPAGKNVWDVQLTDSGRSALKNLKEKPFAHKVVKDCDFEEVSFPLAHKSLLEVTGTQKNGDTVEGDYTWKWVPTETGMQLAKVGLTDAQVADLNHALGYQVYQEDYFSFPIAENVNHHAKQAFAKKDNRWKPVIE